MSFGCCNSFMLCSDEAACVHEGNPTYEGCMYKENLEKGLNFYTIYNIKNELRKKEYLRSKAEPSNREVKTAIKVDCKQVKLHTYVYILNRCFAIGKRASYNNHTLYLTEEERKEISEKLKDCCECSADYDKAKCVDENWSDTNPAWYRPIFIIDGIKYNIMNYNYRVLTYPTAKKIKTFFESRGFDVLIETLGSRGKIFFKQKNSFKDKTKDDIKRDKSQERLALEQEQISLWDLERMKISS